MTPPEDKCPECFNDIYKPYTYCNSCGWEKSEDDDKKKPAKKGKKGKKSVKKDKAKAEKGTTVPCPKCGGKVPVESDKRPVKIECPKCGAKGTLKAKPGEEKEKKEEAPDEARGAGDQAPVGEEESKSEGEEESSSPEPPAPSPDESDEEAQEEEEPKEVKKKPPKKKKGKKAYKKVIPCPSCKEDIVIRSKKRPIRIECESCGKTGTLKK